MQDPDQPVDQIEQIHSIMTRSATFVSLSGLSGVSAGIIGLVAFRFICRILDTVWLSEEVFIALRQSPDLVRHVTGVFFLTLVSALAVAFIFTLRRAKRHGKELWNMASRRFAIHLALPLLAGGVFVAALARLGMYELVCSAMLVFFGLALISAGKYSFSETIVFGVVELVLGLLAAFWVGAGLILWGVGFGVVTAAYGVIMYLQYER